MLRISSVICTHNRGHLLGQVIQSLLDQTLDEDAYEIIVVDNASTDQTADLVRSMAEQDERVRYIPEGELGLSYARNAGIEAARGGIVAFIDDDALAHRRWLAALLHAYETHPSAWAVGGRALPIWETERPGWLHEDLLVYLTIHDLGEQDRHLHWPEILVGTNCSFRRSLFDKIGPFTVATGHNRYGDETELQLRMHQKGLDVYYAPRAVVDHLVPACRLNRSYFWRRAYWQGYSSLTERHFERGPGPWLGVSQMAGGLFGLAFRTIAFACLWPIGSAAERVRRFCMVCAAWGRVRHEWVHLFRVCSCWAMDIKDGEGDKAR